MINWDDIRSVTHAAKPIRRKEIEASELGFAPGQWPDTIQLEDDIREQVFLRRDIVKHDQFGDVLWVDYVCSSKTRIFRSVRILRVYND